MNNQKTIASSPTLVRRSGRAVFDANGQTTWEWQTSTGVFERAVSEDVIDRMSAGLSLLPDNAHSERTWPAHNLANHARPLPKQLARAVQVRRPELKPIARLRGLFTRWRG